MRSPLLFSAFLLLSQNLVFSQTAYYKVKFPDDQTITGCYAYPDTVWPDITKYSDCTFGIGVSVKDQVFNLNAGGGCKKILRTWTLIHWCTYDPNEPWPVYIQNPTDTDVGATVFGVPSNRGHITYTQIIKVLDKEAPTFLNCPTAPLVFCDYTPNDPTQYNNSGWDKCEGPADLSIKVKDLCSGSDILISYRLFLDMDGNGSMETFISSSAANAWPINKMIVGGNGSDTLMASVGFPAGFGLPYGTHKIEWIANDKCGNESICKYEFTVKDCKAPTIVCLNGLSINIMITGMITLWDTDFIQYFSDNCTPNSQIKTGIRKAGTGVGFPTDTHSVTFDCSELGSQEVEVWVVDAYGNADFCTTYVIVQDNIGGCPSSSKLKGFVSDDNLAALSGVQLTLKKGTQTKASPVTGADGLFEIPSMAAGCNYKLTPAVANAVAKTGINTLDALLLAAHLDNKKLLPTPYKLLAADVNKSYGIDANDILGIVKLVLGVQQNFPGQPAWQFIPGNQTFANPAAPWSASIPSSLTFCLSGSMANPNIDFVGFKTGDLNGSAAGSTSGDVAPLPEDRGQSGKRAVFRTSDQTFSAGEEVRVDIITPDLGIYTGFQFTLQYDPAALILNTVEPDLLPADFIARPGEATVTASWHSTALLDPNITAKNIFLRSFTLVFKALKNGKLSDVLQMNSAVTPAEAYNRSLKQVESRLEFLPAEKTPGAAPTLFPAWPNPVQDHVTTSFYLPESGPTTLQLTDANGQVLQSIQAVRERGYHQVDIQLNKGLQPGLLLLHLEAPGGRDVKKIMKL